MRRFGSRPPRRRTVAAIRWASLLGQLGAMGVAVFVFGVECPATPCALIFAFSALLTIAMAPGGGGDARLTENEAIVSLSAAVVQLSSLLYLTGGLANPFAVFLISPAITAALVLSLRGAIAVGSFAALAGLLLLWLRRPLRFQDGWVYEPPPGLELWTFFTLLVALGFIALKLRRLSVEAFDMSTALAATQSALEQQEKISAIGAMAAAMAHELGTPLATIKLTATELKREVADNPEAAEDAALIASQADRCREILSGLSRIKSPEDALIRQAPVMTVLQEAAEPHEEGRARIRYRFNGIPAGPDDPATPQPDFPRRPEIIHGLRNLIQNAADFAASEVRIDVRITDDELRIIIADDGAGFAAEILDRVGEPFATTRGRGVETDNDYVGMGLGVFIAKTLLERTGAELTFENAVKPGSAKRRRGAGENSSAAADSRGPSGAIVQVVWPTGALPIGAARRKPEPGQTRPGVSDMATTPQSPIAEEG